MEENDRRRAALQEQEDQARVARERSRQLDKAGEDVILGLAAFFRGEAYIYHDERNGTFDFRTH